MKKTLLINLLLILFFSQSYAQQTLRFVEDNFLLKEAEKHIQIGSYNQAQNFLTRFLENKEYSQSNFQTQYAYYLHKLCKLYNNNTGAEKEFSNYVNNSNFPMIKERGNFILAQYYYNKNNFEKAIPSYEKSGIDFLTNEEISKRNFELGYAYLATQQINKVEPLFASVKNIPGEYFTPGNYYHGLIAYYKKNYSEATESFKQAEKDERFQSVVPFYLTEIEYLKGNREEALKQALQLMKEPLKLIYYNELNQLVGQINFEKENYSQAEKYFKTYISSCESPRKEDYFRLGYSLYQQGKMKDAIEQFNSMNKSEDELSQQAYYYLSKANLTINKKDDAYNALLNCSQINANEKLREIAFFQMGKLSYENKEDELAFKQLNQFAQAYPNSQYHQEATELLAYLHIKSERFDDAMISMNKMKSISAPLKKMYQRANFERGLQMLLDENSERAISYFNESNRYKIDENIAALTSFWQSETYYRLGKYEQALDFAEYFINNSDASKLSEYIYKAHLLKSYIYFHNDDKQKLNEEFANISNNGSLSPEKLLGTSKSNFIPENSSIVDNNPFVLTYQLPEFSTEFQYLPIPLKPIAMEAMVSDNEFKNYLKFGVGNLSTYNFELGYDASTLAKFPLYVDYKNTNTKGKIKYQNYGETHLGIRTEKELNDYFLNARLDYDRDKQYYYGYNHSLFDYSNTDIRQVFTNVGLHVSALKKTSFLNQLNFKPEMYIGIYTDKFQASETNFSIKVPFENTINSSTTLHTTVEADLNAYHIKNEGTQNNSIFIVKPSFTKIVENGSKITIGLYPAIAQKFHLLPNVLFSHPLKNRPTLFEAGWQSEIILNTFKQITQHNPFIFNSFDVHQSRKSQLFVGLNSNYKKNISITSKVGFAWQTNMPMYLSDTSLDNKQLNVLFEQRATLLLLEGALNYTINKTISTGIDIKLNPVINLKSEKEAWGYRPNTVDLYAKFKATREIMLRADFFIRSGSMIIDNNRLVNVAYTKTLPGTFDVNVSANYHINNSWNVYVDLNNLFNNKYQRWYGYENFGTNAQIGIVRLFNHKKYLIND